jgi:hypothetical protein
MNTIFLIIFLLLSTLCFGQQNEYDSIKPKNNKSSFYLSLGILPIYLSAVANYEIMLVERPDKFFKNSGIRFGGGVFTFWEDYGAAVVATYTSITGKGGNHLEFGFGATYLKYLSYDAEDWAILPAGNIGYRFTKPSSNFIFRTGIGFPEGVYIGFGFRFRKI